MGKRVITRIGDIFSVKINNQYKKYFQYIANDLTQLNSDVIRSFESQFLLDSEPEFSEITSGNIEFYAHCVVSLGVKLGCWEKVGHTNEVGDLDILFRDSNDYGTSDVEISRDWYIWEINKRTKQVGVLKEKYQTLDIGSVVNPYDIVERMQTGSYSFVYPGY